MALILVRASLLWYACAGSYMTTCDVTSRRSAYHVVMAEDIEIEPERELHLAARPQHRADRSDRVDVGDVRAAAGRDLDRSRCCARGPRRRARQPPADRARSRGCGRRWSGPRRSRRY